VKVERIATARLRSHHLWGGPLRSPEALVQFMGAMQAQDLPMAKWALDRTRRRPRHRLGWKHNAHHGAESAGSARVDRSRRALPITDTELRDMAAAAMTGDSRIPKKGYSRPAATGTPRVL